MRTSRSIYRRLGALAAAVASVALVAGACGGDDSTGDSGGVASIPTTTSPAADATTAGSAPSGTAGATGDPATDILAYSQCMRDNGIAKFPDPDANGALGIDGATLGIEMDSPQFKAAEEACAQYMPDPDDAPSVAVDREQILEYSQCMRDNGIADFPDPNPKGGLEVSGIDPFTPQYKAAEEACKQFLPDGGEGGSTNMSDG